MVQKRHIINEIILVLLKENMHVREIARKLDESHSTILRKINILKKENVLDFKTEGKNKVFHIKNTLEAKNYVFSAEKYKLNKLLKKYPEMIILNDILKITKDMTVLFGSYARFKAKKDSDIDIYIETKSKKTKEDIELLNSKINIKIGEFNKDSELIKEIIKDHVIIRGIEEFYEKTKFFG